MAREKSKKEESGSSARAAVLPRNIVSEMKESYLDYAMSVITARALPDVRDGLKPVHRRILFAMQQMGLTQAAKFRKSATVVGEVLGSYHPHGDASVYDALVKLAQDFATRYPLVLGQGNFGSIDGDAPAAYRYTEAKMSRLAGELLADIEKETVDFRPNYDGTKAEPTVLPAIAPNLLLNGTLGIAVGMATNIPPHNLSEVADAASYLVDHPEATTEDLLQFIKGPDFPTGGVIFGEKDLHHAYATGRGGVVVRGVADITETKAGSFQIVISQIPFRVNKADLIEKIAGLVREKRLEGVKALRDESTKDIRVVIELKAGSQPQKILNFLYKHTQLEDAFHFNLVALVDGVPQTLSLKNIIEEFVSHRRRVIRRRTEFDLARSEEREHILFGLKKALDHIDRIIKLIKGSRTVLEAHAGLQREFKFSDKQATAILEMKLQKLAGLERQKIEDELRQVQALIAELRGILENPKKISAIIKKEMAELEERYGDERCTKIVKHAAKSFSAEDLIPEEENALVLTAGGYIKRTNPDEYRRQRRGGVGVVDLDTKEEDFVTHFLTASTHSDLLFFTDRGKVYQIKMYEIPEGKRATRGKSVMNFISLGSEEKITSILPVPKEAGGNESLSLMMVTRCGSGKKVSAQAFRDVRGSGIIAIKLPADDLLISVSLADRGDTIAVVSAKGQSIRFKESDVREMGRGAAGVRVMKLGKGDRVIGAQVVKKGALDAKLMVVSELGFGKKTALKEYKIQRRGGSGVKTAKVTAKTGSLISSAIIDEGTEEVVAISQKSHVIRTGIGEIPNLGRQTQGVRIMRLRQGDRLASLICL
ncbi:DNA gyrase subunit A [Patescibacteria group bacterium]|nr:MAG: DNA gyrase subunit A [Patescibacteria group bacterium]